MMIYLTPASFIGWRAKTFPSERNPTWQQVVCNQSFPTSRVKTGLSTLEANFTERIYTLAEVEHTYWQWAKHLPYDAETMGQHVSIETLLTTWVQ